MTKEEIIKRNKNNKKQNYFLKGGIIVAEKKKIANSLEELTNQFEDVNNKYDLTTNKDKKLSNSLNLTKLDDVSVNEDEITKLAKDSLQDYYTTNINSINSKNKNAIENLNNSIETQKENVKNLKNSVNNTIEEVKQDASNDALKRGLARSSIIINKLNAFDNAKIAEYNKIDKELTNSVNKINDEINALNKEKEDALSDFNITYASKINEKINALNKELQEKQTQITKYNNEIAQIEAKYEKDKASFNNDLDQQDFNNYVKLSNFIANYGINSLNTIKNSEKYEYALDYFNSLPREDAFNILRKNEDMLVRELGSTYFNQLVKKFSNV